MIHEHYFRDIPKGVTKMDIYRFLDLFGVTCPVAQHVIKKAVAAGQRGHKDVTRDWQDVQDSAARKLQMIEEDGRINTAALNGEMSADDLAHKILKAQALPGEIVYKEDEYLGSGQNPNKR